MKNNNSAQLCYPITADDEMKQTVRLSKVKTLSVALVSLGDSSHEAMFM